MTRAADIAEVIRDFFTAERENDMYFDDGEGGKYKAQVDGRFDLDNLASILADAFPEGEEVRSWYEGRLPDGTLWIETKALDELVDKCQGRNCTFTKFTTYEQAYREENYVPTGAEILASREARDRFYGRFLPPKGHVSAKDLGL